MCPYRILSFDLFKTNCYAPGNNRAKVERAIKLSNSYFLAFPPSRLDHQYRGDVGLDNLGNRIHHCHFRPQSDDHSS